MAKEYNRKYVAFANKKLFGEEFLCTSFKCAHHLLDREHLHDYIQIFYVKSGSHKHIVNGVEYEPCAGSLVFISPYTHHYVDNRLSNDDFYSRSISFPEEFFNSLSGDKLEFNGSTAIWGGFELYVYRKLSEQENIIAKESINAIIAELGKANETSAKTIHLHLRKILTLLKSKTRATPPGRVHADMRLATRQAISYILENLDNSFKLEDVCRYVGMSRTSLATALKTITGLSFSEFIVALKIQRANCELVETDKSSSRISEEYNFYDRSHFYKCYTQVMGCSPTEYRKKYREDDISNEELAKKHDIHTS